MLLFILVSNDFLKYIINIIIQFCIQYLQILVDRRLTIELAVKPIYNYTQLLISNMHYHVQ